jgi:Na+/alanine symporter
MSTKCAENILAVRYRDSDAEDNPIGGPFSYIRLGLIGWIQQNLCWKTFPSRCCLWSSVWYICSLYGIQTVYMAQ